MLNGPDVVRSLHPGSMCLAPAVIALVFFVGAPVVVYAQERFTPVSVEALTDNDLQSAMIHDDVFGEAITEVHEVIRSENGEISGIMVKVGVALGLGESDVTLPMHSFDVARSSADNKVRVFVSHAYSAEQFLQRRDDNQPVVSNPQGHVSGEQPAATGVAASVEESSASDGEVRLRVKIGQFGLEPDLSCDHWVTGFGMKTCTAHTWRFLQHEFHLVLEGPALDAAAEQVLREALVVGVGAAVSAGVATPSPEPLARVGAGLAAGRTAFLNFLSARGMERLGRQYELTIEHSTHW